MDDLPQGILSKVLKEQPSLIRGWSNDDVQRQLTYSLLHGADWAQTRTIAKNPDKFYETNPILGKHPSSGFVNNYFLGTLLTQGLIANALSPEWRKLFQYGGIGLEGVEVGRNKFKFGIGMTF